MDPKAAQHFLVEAAPKPGNPAPALSLSPPPRSSKADQGLGSALDCSSLATIALARALRSRGRVWPIEAAAAAAGAGVSPLPGAGMSRSSKAVLGLSVLLTAATVAGVHLKQRQDRQRLRDGVIRDIERQNQKKENIRLLGEQIILTKQLEAEREKMLEKGSQNT